MKLIKEWTERDIGTYVKNDKLADKLIKEHWVDGDYIEIDLAKKYPDDKYFVLVDYIEEGNGYFHIRIWKKEVE